MEYSGSALLEAYVSMYDRFGDPHWWPGETPFEVCVGAILTQNTAWTNVERSIDRLKMEGLLDPRRIADIGSQVLARAIQSSGFFNQKAAYLKEFCSFLMDRFDGDVGAMSRMAHDQLRGELLAIKGIGMETADSILCYACGAPILVIDAYTRRLLRRLSPMRWSGSFGGREPSYGELQGRIMGALLGDSAFYNRFHALVVLECKNHCLKEPICPACPLNGICITGRKGL